MTKYNTNMISDENLLELINEIERIQSIRKPNTSAFKYSDKLSKKAKKVLNGIEKNNNNSWAVYMFERNFESILKNKVAIKYRGNRITYEEMYSKAFEYCKSLKALGVKKGDQVPVCTSNIPEYLYLLLACSFIGATIHLVGNWFNKDYLEDIINKTGSDIMFISEDKYEKIADVVEKSNVKIPVLMSLEDSLMKGKDGKPFNPYQELDGPTHVFSSRFWDFKIKSSKAVINQKDFLEYGKSYRGEVLENCSLDDVSTISYTSGTTKKGHPKGVKHSNRAYIIISRFKLSDVSGMPEMKDLTAQYEVPVYSHTNLGNVVDTFGCNCTYVAEPFCENNFLMKSLMINRPNYCQSTLGRWLYLGKELSQPENKNVDFPELIMADIVGEGCSAGEEKFLNRIAREHKFGTKKLPFPLSPVTFSIGGGTCEAGGVFTTLFHALQEKRLALYGKKYSLGLIPFNMIDYEVLNLEGDYCKINEPGLLVVDSPVGMVGYTEEECDPSAYVQDKYGRKWINMGTLAYKADPVFKSVKFKGRVNDFEFLKDGSLFPTYKIEESISKDTKNIMSCSVVKNEAGNYICHIEKQPNSRKNIAVILRSCKKRLKATLPTEIYDRVFFRIRSYDESFPLAESGKRDLDALRLEPDAHDFIYISDIPDDLFKKESNLVLKLFK